MVLWEIIALHVRSTYLFSVSYVKTKALAGTLHGLKGFQDPSLLSCPKIGEHPHGGVKEICTFIT